MKSKVPAFLAALIATCTGAHVFAQSRPIPPSNPASQKECNDFTRAYKAYLGALQARYESCSRANSKVSVQQYLPAFKCTTLRASQVVKVPPACVASNNDWDCAVDYFGRLNRECSTAAAQNERATLKKTADDLDASLRKVMTETAAGVPGMASSASAQLAKWWASQTDSSTLSAMLKAAQVNGYGRTANDIRTIFGSTKDPVTRAEKLTGLFDVSGNLISREMTGVAVRGVAQTGREAISVLDDELARFNSEVDQAKNEALAKRDPEAPHPNRQNDYCAPGNSTDYGACCGPGYYPSKGGYNCFPDSMPGN